MFNLHLWAWSLVLKWRISQRHHWAWLPMRSRRDSCVVPVCDSLWLATLASLMLIGHPKMGILGGLIWVLAVGSCLFNPIDLIAGSRLPVSNILLYFSSSSFLVKYSWTLNLYFIPDYFLVFPSLPSLPRPEAIPTTELSPVLSGCIFTLLLTIYSVIICCYYFVFKIFILTLHYVFYITTVFYLHSLLLLKRKTKSLNSVTHLC